MADLTAGHLLASGVLAALVGARTAGEGQLVEVSLLGAALAVQIQDLVWLEGEATGPATAASRADLTARAEEIGGGLAMNPYYRCYEAADGFFAVACLNLPQRQSFLGLFGLEDPTIAAPDLVPDDPEVLDAKQRLTAVVEEAILAAPVEAWLARFGAVAVPVGPVLARESVHADDQVRANGLLQDVAQPGLGRVTMLGAIFGINAEDAAPTRPAPTLGADTDAVLAEVGA
jgi:crotonobetainyl-CoA:carnitine CoA-transferase CaiB-like acyl-CoA transferase